MQREAKGQIYHAGIRNRFSLSIPCAGHVQMMAPVPGFFSLALSGTGKADASSALTFVPFGIPIGQSTLFSSIIRSIPLPIESLTDYTVSSELFPEEFN